MTSFTRPKLRDVRVQRTIFHGVPIFVLQNSLRLTTMPVLLPQALGPLAMLCNGEYTAPEIRATLVGQYGIDLSQGEVDALLDQFDQALILESERLRQAKQEALATYRAAPFRPPALTGHSYPAEPARLRRLLQGYLDRRPVPPPASPHSRGLISPHIDFPRGGPIYAQVWASAAEAIRQAELIIIFGTDHHGGYGSLTLTPQNYASPFGVMPTDTGLVERLVTVLGPEAAFAEELHHRDEWSIELDLVWLQYLRQEKPCPILPVLCGSFGHFMTGEAELNPASQFKPFIDILRDEMARRRTVVVASGDLAHLGPEFDGPALDSAAQAQMEVDDAALLANLAQGQALEFYEFMKAQYDRNVCGLAPFYFTLDLLGQTEGTIIAYDRCPADQSNTSFVSVCGMIFS
jgi:hypothetical protein